MSLRALWALALFAALFCARNVLPSMADDTIPTSSGSSMLLLLSDDTQRMLDMQISPLAMFGPTADVDTFSLTTGTPTITLWNSYHSIFVWTSYGANLNNAEAFGNVLADYVDGGHGVVLSVFGWGKSFPRGRFLSGKY